MIIVDQWGSLWKAAQPDPAAARTRLGRSPAGIPAAGPQTGSGTEPPAPRNDPRLASLGLAALVLGAAWGALESRWLDAVVLGGLATAGGLLVCRQNELPRLAGPLILIAVLINAAGFMLNLWRNLPWFDAIVHLYTSFAVTAGLGLLALAHTRFFAPASTRVAAIAGCGLVLGILWEAFEWAVGIIGTRRDTVLDLVMDALGAAGAGLFCAWLVRSPWRRAAGSGAHRGRSSSIRPPGGSS